MVNPAVLQPIFASKIMYINIFERTTENSLSHAIPKSQREAKPIFWVVVLFVSVDCPPVGAKLSELMKNIVSHVQIEQLFAYLRLKPKKPVLRTIIHFPS